MATLIQVLLFFAALVLAALGFLTLSPATTGVGFIGLAALAGILTRVIQAEVQHKALEARLSELALETSRNKTQV